MLILTRKVILSAVILNLGFFSSALGERLIVKNARENVGAAMPVIKSFRVGEDKYEVVSLNNVSSAVDFAQLQSQLQRRFAADQVFRDIPLYANLGHPKAVKKTDAWHVKKLDYAKLPKDKDGSGIIVAVIDTGVDYEHDHLKNRMWKNKGEIAGNGLDDDGNGFVDDVYGYNFIDKGSPDPMDRNGHGTHCAGIISAEEHPTTTAVGVAPGVKIMAIKVIGTSSGFLSDAIEGIVYSVDNGAQVLSNSWRLYSDWSAYYSKEGKELLRKTIQWVESKDVIFVAAAGNESRDNDTHRDGDKLEIIPAGFYNLDLMVVVAASSSRGMWFRSNYGVASVEVVAPGADIQSTLPNNRWASWSGTSMAAPIVSGAIARALSGGMTPTKAVKKLLNTTNLSTKWTKKSQFGHVNLVDYLK